MPVASAAAPQAEIRALTGLRGVAALMVLWFHLGTGVFTVWPLRVIAAHGYIWVDCFFELSGFLMALTFPVRLGPGLGRLHAVFLGRRLARIYPLYAATTLVSFALTELGWDALSWARLDAPLLSLLANALMLQNAAWFLPWPAAGWSISINPAAWSLSTEWLAYLVYPALALACLSRHRLLAVAMAAAVCAALALLTCGRMPLPQAAAGDVWFYRAGACAWGLPSPLGRGVLDIWTGDSPAWLRCMADFTLGLLAFRVRLAPAVVATLQRRPAGVAIGGALLALLAVPSADLAIVALFGLLILALLRPDAPASRWLGGGLPYWLGVYSYALYMVHEPLRQSAAYPWLARHTAGPVTLAAACMAIVFPLAIAAHALVEKPGRRWGRRLLKV